MSNVAPLRLGLGTLAVVALLAVPVRFEMFIQDGQLTKVKNFEASNYNYPNVTPPIPGGHPTGNCIPGNAYWTRFGDSIGRQGDSTYTLKFGKGSLDPNEFHGKDRYPAAPDDPYYWLEAYGKVRVEKKNGKFDVHAHGWFVDARSEAGLQYGGGSSGIVEWKAHEVVD